MLLIAVNGEYLLPFGNISVDTFHTVLNWYFAIGLVTGPWFAWHLCGYWYRIFKAIRPGDVFGGLLVMIFSIPGWSIFALFLGLTKIIESPFWSKSYKVGNKK